MSVFSSMPQKRKAFPPDVHVQLFRRQNGYCAYEECKGKMIWNDFEIDHLIPISRGGGNEIENLSHEAYAKFQKEIPSEKIFLKYARLFASGIFRTLAQKAS